MGCFSFICPVCDKGILSNSIRGEKVRLYLIRDGKVLESMVGEYDSYGRVFDKEQESIEWTMEWNDVCDLMFDPDTSNGILAIHEKCFTNLPPQRAMVRSESDPNQGWGESGELFTDIDEDLELNT